MEEKPYYTVFNHAAAVFNYRLLGKVLTGSHAICTVRLLLAVVIQSTLWGHFWQESFNLHCGFTSGSSHSIYTVRSLLAVVIQSTL